MTQQETSATSVDLSECTKWLRSHCRDFASTATMTRWADAIEAISSPSGDAAAPVGDVEELMAQLVYEQWSGLPGYVPWVKRGNSFRQDDARRAVRDALSKGGL